MRFEKKKEQRQAFPFYFGCECAFLLYRKLYLSVGWTVGSSVCLSVAETISPLVHQLQGQDKSPLHRVANGLKATRLLRHGQRLSGSYQKENRIYSQNLSLHSYPLLSPFPLGRHFIPVSSSEKRKRIIGVDPFNGRSSA